MTIVVLLVTHAHKTAHKNAIELLKKSLFLAVDAKQKQNISPEVSVSIWKSEVWLLCVLYSVDECGSLYDNDVELTRPKN